MFLAISRICRLGCFLAFVGFGLTDSVGTCSIAMPEICSRSRRASASVNRAADELSKGTIFGFLFATITMAPPSPVFVHADEFPRGRHCNARARQRRPVCTDHSLPQPSLVYRGIFETWDARLKGAQGSCRL